MPKILKHGYAVTTEAPLNAPIAAADSLTAAETSEIDICSETISPVTYFTAPGATFGASCLSATAPAVAASCTERPIMSQPKPVASSFAPHAAAAGHHITVNRTTRDTLTTMLAFALFVVAGVVVLSAMVPQAPADLAMPVLLDSQLG